MAARYAITDTPILADNAARQQREGMLAGALTREVGVVQGRVRRHEPRAGTASEAVGTVDMALPRCNVSRGDSFNSGGSAARVC
jgi:hypothetical protein